jgi:hypothetical protein
MMNGWGALEQGRGPRIRFALGALVLKRLKGLCREAAQLLRQFWNRTAGDLADGLQAAAYHGRW